MDDQIYQAMFKELDIPAAIFKVKLASSYVVEDILIEECNNRYYELLKSFGANQVLHQSAFQVTDYFDPRWNYYFYQAAIRRQHVHGLLHDFERNHWIEVSGGPALDEHSCWMTFVDRTVSKLLMKLSRIDSLTNVKNRRAYQSDIAKLKKMRVSIGVIFADINSLKEANDQGGHQAGDQHLRHAAELLCSLAGDNLPYRIGGDEFVLLLPNRTSSEVEIMLQRLREFEKVSFSIGAHWSKDSLLIEETINQADQEMYLAKKEYYRQHQRYHVE